MIREVRLFVSGHVQGVGFRARAKRLADALQLKGFAKNLADGRVEICLQGEENQIKTFLRSLQENPGQGSISHIEQAWQEGELKLSQFNIVE